jgi:hypothetical protein
VKHSVAIAALVVAAIGLTALPAVAQDQTTPVAKRSDREVHRTIIRDGHGMGRGGLLGLVCSDKGAEALEVAFVRLSHRLDLTDAQSTLFDAFKTNALTTQTSFADDCKAALPDRTAEATPDLVDGLKARLAIQQAELTAMNQILPDFEAFYASLTDAQKADFMPRMGREGGGDRMGRGPNADRDAPGRIHRLPAPGRD